MEYRVLGSTGVRVSELCLGTMQFGWTADIQTSFAILDAAYEAGVNFIDTADIYSNWVAGNSGGEAETIIGDWLTSRRIERQKLVIATKVRGPMGKGPNDAGLSRSHILNSVHASLKRLKTDYLDLYQAHWYDETTPIEETLRAFDDLIRVGKVRAIGCSNYPAWRLMQALWASDRLHLARYSCLQPHYNLVKRAEFERELRDVCFTYGLGVIPYSPLAGGFLTGKYRKDQAPESARAERAKRYASDQNWRLLEKMEALAHERGAWSISQVALVWLLTDPLITSPIIGPRTLEQLADNLAACGCRLTPEEKQVLDENSRWD